MPGHLKALLVILPLAFLAFTLAAKPATAFMERADFLRRRNVWLALTLVAFLAQSFWVYALIAGLLLIHAAARESNLVALYFIVLMVLPPTEIQIPGFGLINYFFSLSHQRLLALVLLLPAFLRLQQKADTIPFGRLLADKLLAAFMLLVLVLALRHTTLTDMMRSGLYLFIDVLLPYFVISRSLKDVQAFREALFSFTLSALVLALILVFESARHWHLYRALSTVLDMPMDSLSFLERGGVLRAMGTTGHPIVAGYVMTVALGFMLALRASIRAKWPRRLAMAALTAGLIAPFSRGPWVGAVLLVGVFLASGPHAIRRLATLGLAGVLALPLLALLPGGQKVIDLLPFVGSVESGSVDYRAQLLENTWAVILRNPLFGSVDFARAPEMQAMIQGQGLIDVVNSYLLISLNYGLVGLGLFLGVFVFVAWGLHRGLGRLPDRETDEARLGRALLATLAAVLAIIFTVSSVGLIPIVLWSVAGLGVAYGQMIRHPPEASPAQGT